MASRTSLASDRISAGRCSAALMSIFLLALHLANRRHGDTESAPEDVSWRLTSLPVGLGMYG